MELFFSWTNDLMFFWCLRRLQKYCNVMLHDLFAWLIPFSCFFKDYTYSLNCVLTGVFSTFLKQNNDPQSLSLYLYT